VDADASMSTPYQMLWPSRRYYHIWHRSHGGSLERGEALVRQCCSATGR
jgi:hypothetical protein